MRVVTLGGRVADFGRRRTHNNPHSLKIESREDESLHYTQLNSNNLGERQYWQNTEFLAAQLQAKATSWEGGDKIYGCAMLGNRRCDSVFHFVTRQLSTRMLDTLTYYMCTVNFRRLPLILRYSMHSFAFFISVLQFINFASQLYMAESQHVERSKHVREAPISLIFTHHTPFTNLRARHTVLNTVTRSCSCSCISFLSYPPKYCPHFTYHALYHS